MRTLKELQKLVSEHRDNYPINSSCVTRLYNILSCAYESAEDRYKPLIYDFSQCVPEGAGRVTMADRYGIRYCWANGPTLRIYGKQEMVPDLIKGFKSVRFPNAEHILDMLKFVFPNYGKPDPTVEELNKKNAEALAAIYGKNTIKIDVGNIENLWGGYIYANPVRPNPYR
jgi:hypothetical protein